MKTVLFFFIFSVHGWTTIKSSTLQSCPFFFSLFLVWDFNVSHEIEYFLIFKMLVINIQFTLISQEQSLGDMLKQDWKISNIQ